MTKYIIELEDDIKYLIINGRADNRCYTLVRPVEELEILNSDYINENFGDMQDDAYKRGYADAERIWRAPSSDNEFYQKGFEDGKNSYDKGCEGCKWEWQSACGEPCKNCTNCYTNKYEPMPKEDDRIEVGDEIKWNSDVIVITRVYEDGGFNWCDGISQDGRAFHVLAENVRKTGRHFDIASILEAMRT